MTAEPGSGKKLAGVGSLVFAWTFFDGLILGLPILFAAIVIDQRLIVFAVGAALWTVINVEAGGWIQREWDAWIVGTRFETRLDKLRNSSRARRPIEWITRGYTFLFALAAILTSAAGTIALHRLLTGRSAERSRFMAAALGPGIFWPALFTFVGYEVSKAL